MPFFQILTSDRYLNLCANAFNVICGLSALCAMITEVSFCIKEKSLILINHLFNGQYINLYYD